jgi:hypothetical protein
VNSKKKKIWTPRTRLMDAGLLRHLPTKCEHMRRGLQHRLQLASAPK